MKDNIVDNLKDLGFTEIEEGSYENRRKEELSLEEIKKKLGIGENELGLFTQGSGGCCKDTERANDYQCDSNDNEETSIADLLKYVDGDYETYESVEDMINEPPHYATRHIQPNDYIDDLLEWNTALTPREGYYVGQIHRYLGRAGMKEGNAKMQDFKKAQYYMNRMIEKSDTD